MALLAVTPFVYVPGILYPSTVPRAVYFRVLVGVAFLLIATLWARERWKVDLSAARREWVGMGLAVFALVQVFTAAIGVTPAVGTLGDMIRMEGSVAWLGYLLFFLLLRSLFDGESWPSLLRLVAIVSGIVAGWSLMQAYGELFGVALVGWGSSRVVGTLGLEGPLAIYMILGASIAGFLAARAPTRVRRLGWWTLAAANLWIAVLTGTRSALVAIAVALVVTGGSVLMFSPASSRLRTYAARALVWFGVAVAGLFLLGDLAGPGVGRLLDIGADALTSRLHLWRTAWSGFLDHPLTGIGPGGFEVLYDRHFVASDYLASAAAHHDRAHNVILGTMAESGALGLLAYSMFWGAALRTAVHLLRVADEDPELLWLVASVAAYLVYLMLWFEDLGSFHVLLIVLAFLEHRRLNGAMGTSGSRGRDESARRRGRMLRWRWSVPLAALLVFGGIGWYHGQVLGAARQTRAAMAASAPLEPFRHFERALEYHTASTREITSRYVTGLIGLADFVRSGRVDPPADSVASHFERARRAVEEEIARQPDYSVVHARLSRVHQARWRWSGDHGEFRSAVSALQRAREISPDRVRYLHRLARLHIQNGDPPRAMELLERALDRLPGWWETYNTMAQVQWDAGHRERAVGLLLRAARTDVRYSTSGTGTQFMVRAGSWLEARGTPLQAVELFEAYLGTRYPGWDEPPGPAVNDVPAAALPIAARLPITLMRAGRIDEARRAALRLRERLPPHLRRPVVTDRLDRFVADMEAGRADRWRDAWGVLPTDVPLGG